MQKISEALEKARMYEEREEGFVPAGMRPVYHLSPRVGWLNDPNGFSFYGGRYHLFYQYHPYDTFWGPMHWGHAVSDDLLNWEYLPAALAPDMEYDDAGCFSGSSVTMQDGRQLIMYTGCAQKGRDPEGKWRQTQCVAVSDGDEFIKYAGNPVLAEEDLPSGGDIYEFRDPYLWVCEDGSFRALVANAKMADNKATQLTVYRSDDGFRWERAHVMFEDYLKIGIMWECPNYIRLDGQQVLIASPMDMEAEEADGSIRFPKGNNVCYILGEYDEKKPGFRADREAESGRYAYFPVDNGLDFYAPQVKQMPDGRTILIGWMQDPQWANNHQVDMPFFGQMTVPRELSVQDGKLYQVPIRELLKQRHKIAGYEAVWIEREEITLPGISGRVMDLVMSVSAEDMREFCLRFAKKDNLYTELRWNSDKSVMTIDRSHSGQMETISSHRTFRVNCEDGRLRLRLLLDRWSCEVFVNGGEQVATLTYYTPQEARDITFRADGRALLSVEAYRLDPNQ